MAGIAVTVSCRRSRSIASTQPRRFPLELDSLSPASSSSVAEVSGSASAVPASMTPASAFSVAFPLRRADRPVQEALIVPSWLPTHRLLSDLISRRRGRVACHLASSIPATPDGNDSLDDDLQQFKRPEGLQDQEFEELLTRMDHVNTYQRNKASLTLAANLRDDTVPRLLEMLQLTDTRRRRQAVQTLGAIGPVAVLSICEQLRRSLDRTVRASCCKSITAIVVSHPYLRETFPDDALSSIAAALTDADPITRISACISLGELGSCHEESGAPGNPRALSILLSALRETDDIALASSLSGAIATIGINGKKNEALAALREAVAQKGDMDGGDYLRQICESCIERVESGRFAPS